MIFQDPATSDRFCFCVSPNHYICLLKDDVVYIAVSAKGYALIHAIDGKEYELSTNLGNVEKQLGSQDFIRISRQYLVNRKHISAIKGTEVRMGTIRLEMSKTGSQRLFRHLPILWTGQIKNISKVE